MPVARVIGVGDFTPPRAISNERIARAIPGWSAEAIREKTGIVERRFLCDFDDERGMVIRPPQSELGSSVDMAEVALWQALEQAHVGPSSLDALFFVTGTPDRPDFNWDAMKLHERLGMRSDAMALVISNGCGGTPYILHLVNQLLTTGAMKSVAIVASHFASAYLDRGVYTQELELEPGKKLAAYLSFYVFGDGAGAMVLRGDSAGRGIESSMISTTPGDLVIRRGGGNERPFFSPGTVPADFAWIINGHVVGKGYPEHMQVCLSGVTGGHLERLADVKRFYLHQPNKKVLDKFISMSDLGAERVAITVDRYGNTSAAGMLIALSEDVRNGVVPLDGNDLICIAAVGANVHSGAQLIHL